MPTVDDLVVSVRIDETSNLGKLQKQLTALVGKDGKKTLNLAGFGGTGGDLAFIKNKLMELSPITLGRENKQVKETVKTTIRQLQRKEIQDILTAKIGVSKEEIKSWVSFMAEELADKESNIVGLSGLLREIHAAIYGATAEGGPAKTTLTAIRKKIPERYMQRIIEGTLKEMGEWFEGQFQIYEIDKEKVAQYRVELDKAITDKSEEIKNLDEGSINITKSMKDDLIKLSKDTRDSEEFVKTAVRDILKMGAEGQLVIEKLKIGAKDPILELLALMRTKSTTTSDVTLVENLKNLLPKFKETLMVIGASRVDIKLTREVIEKMIDKAEELGIKIHDFGGALADLKNQPQEIITELKNIWNKTNVKRELQHDKRFIETGKDFAVLMGISHTKGGLDQLKKESESSKFGGKYVYLEFLPKFLEEKLGTPEDLDNLLDEQGVYDNVDRVLQGIEEIKGSYKSLIEQTIDKDPDNLKRLINELAGMTDYLEEIAETSDDIMDAVNDQRQSLIPDPQREGGDEEDT